MQLDCRQLHQSFVCFMLVDRVAWSLKAYSNFPRPQVCFGPPMSVRGCTHSSMCVRAQLKFVTTRTVSVDWRALVSNRLLHAPVKLFQQLHWHFSQVFSYPDLLSVTSVTPRRQQSFSGQARTLFSWPLSYDWWSNVLIWLVLLWKNTDSQQMSFQAEGFLVLFNKKLHFLPFRHSGKNAQILYFVSPVVSAMLPRILL